MATPAQRDRMNVKEAMRFMKDPEIEAAAIDATLPKWARKMYAAEAAARVEAANPVTQVGTIDLTPTWASALQVALLGLEHGTDEGKRLARQELARMAALADAAVCAQPTLLAVAKLQRGDVAGSDVGQEVRDAFIAMDKRADAILGAR